MATKTIDTARLDLLDPPAADTALVPTDPAVGMFERLATNPDVDVAKLEKLIAMQERILAHNAKSAFDAAFSEMQGEIPIITERGEITVNGVLRSRYATLEDILEVVRPILQKYGFAIRHRNQFNDGKLKIIGILSHRSGHSEQDEFEAKADNSGSKNDIQALGSTQSYGQRYTTKNLLGIATRGADDDGKGSAKAGKPDVTAPTGFENWWLDLEAVAAEGWPKLSQAWSASKVDYRNHLMQTNKDGWTGLKRKAEAVKK